VKSVIYGIVAARIAGVGHRVALMTGLGYVFTSGESTDGWFRRALRVVVGSMYRGALVHASTVVFQNQDDSLLFERLGIVRGGRGVVVGGTGVELSQWEIADPFLEPVTFLMAARLLREKGVREYIEAAREVRRRNTKVRFLLLLLQKVRIEILFVPQRSMQNWT
jgi:glycosyltransferase involved in cell wall biosynthesis